MRNNIIQGYPIPQKDYYKVDVRSITYNQSKYIEDCLNGVAMQKTDFPFLHHVIDDCSTDGEQDVIKAWIESECDIDNAEFYDNDICTITLAKHKSNPNYTIAAYFLKRNMYGNPEKRKLYKPWQDVCPYEALCEGDDYWIDAKKLQKQADFMDANNEFSLCFHKVQTKVEDNRSYRDIFGFLITKEYTLNDVFSRWTVPTCSMFYRKEIYKKIPQNSNFVYGDNVLVLTCLREGRIFCFGEDMGVYRLNAGGWTAQNRLKQSLLQVKHHIGLVESFDFCRQSFFYERISSFWIIALSELLVNSDKKKYNIEIENYKDFFPNKNLILVKIKIFKEYLKIKVKRLIKK